MNVMLGDLTIEEIEKRTEVKFPEELKLLMQNSHQPSANNIEYGKWHCFDIPFMLVCGDETTARTIYGHLSPLSSLFKEQLQIGVSG